MAHQALDGYTSSGALLPPSHPDVQLVRRLGAAVVGAALEGLGGGAAAERLRGLRWEFNVVTDASKGNCYVTAGGKVRAGRGRVGNGNTYQRPSLYRTRTPLPRRAEYSCPAARSLEMLILHRCG